MDNQSSGTKDQEPAARAETAPHRDANRRSRFAAAVVIAAALVYAWLVYRNASPFAAGSDSSGYLNSARLLAAGKASMPAREVPGYPKPWPYYSHMPLGFTIDADGRIAPTYPIGLPLHLAALAPIVGWEKTARVVSAVNVLAAGALLYALARRLGVRAGWAVAGVAALWLSPVWIMFALQPMSDPLAVTWTLLALIAALRSREQLAWAFGAGAALGVAVLVRPANVVVAIPMLFALRPHWRAWLACAAAGAPFAAAILVYNRLAYGAALMTGYGAIGESFELGIVPHNLAHFAWWVPLLVGAPLALAAIALPLIRTNGQRVERLTLSLLAAWFLSLVAFYASYWFAGETWWYVRFLLPAFPAVIIAGALVWQRVAERGKFARIVAITCVGVGLLSQRVLGQRLLPESIREGERRYYLVCQWFNAHAPADAIVASSQLSGAQIYYTPFPLLRWDQLPRDEMERAIRGLVAAKRPLYAVMFKFEEDNALREHLPGRWTKLHEIENDVAIWQYAGEAP